MSHNTKSNELRTQILEEMEARRIDHKTYIDAKWLLDQYDTLKDTEKGEAVREIIKMADALEVECGLDGDKGTKQWMAFKGFRNSIRDKFLTTPLPESDKTE